MYSNVESSYLKAPVAPDEALRIQSNLNPDLMPFRASSDSSRILVVVWIVSNPTTSGLASRDRGDMCVFRFQRSYMSIEVDRSNPRAPVLNPACPDLSGILSGRSDMSIARIFTSITKKIIYQQHQGGSKPCQNR